MDSGPWCPRGPLRAATRAHTLAGTTLAERRRRASPEWPRPQARVQDGEAALRADSCSQARDTARQAPAPGRDTHLSRGSQARPPLPSVRHPGCSGHRGLRANEPFFRRCSRLTSQAYPLCRRSQTLRTPGWMSPPGWMTPHFCPDRPFRGVSHPWSSSGRALLRGRNRKSLWPAMTSRGPEPAGASEFLTVRRAWHRFLRMLRVPGHRMTGGAWGRSASPTGRPGARTQPGVRPGELPVGPGAA